MKIVTVSLNQIWEDKHQNLLLCEEYINEASRSSVDLIIFPEMTLTGFSMNTASLSEDENDSKTLKDFQHLSSKYNISIVFGMIIKDLDKAKNRAYFINHDNNSITLYDKIHPFTFANEDKYFNSGEKLSYVEYRDFKIGLSICYDLRFSKLYDLLSEKCNVIINIANWPKKRVDHWNTLLKARAIENQIFMIGVNRIGIDGNALEYVESSNVFNANGEKEEYSTYKDMKIFKIDIKKHKNFIKNFSTLQDKKRMSFLK